MFTQSIESKRRRIAALQKVLDAEKTELTFLKLQQEKHEQAQAKANKEKVEPLPKRLAFVLREVLVPIKVT